MEPKIYLSYNQIHQTVQKLFQKVRSSGYDPDVMVAIGAGGFVPARILRTYLKIPILTVGLSYYDEKNRVTENPKKVQWIDEVEKKLSGKKLLLVDEVDDSRTTLVYCLQELFRHNPKEISVAVLHNKRKKKNAPFPEQMRRYFYGEELEDRWICYPWDAEDILAHDKHARGT